MSQSLLLLFTLVVGLVTLLLIFLKNRKTTDRSAITVTGVFVYPIKSCGVIPLDKAQIDKYGFKHDRKWVVALKKDMKFLTQRDEPKMALIKPRFNGDKLELSAPDMSLFKLPLEGINKSEPVKQVYVWGSYYDCVDEGDEAAEWFSKSLGRDVRLVRMPDQHTRKTSEKYQLPGQDNLVSFADGFPFLLVSEESIADLNRLIRSKYPEEPLVDERRFRPNILIKGVKPYEEESWLCIDIGENRFYLPKRCVRCPLTTVDPDQGKFLTAEPLRTLTKERQSRFCQNMTHDTSSYGLYLKKGDAIRVLDKIEPNTPGTLDLTTEMED